MDKTQSARTDCNSIARGHINCHLRALSDICAELEHETRGRNDFVVSRGLFGRARHLMYVRSRRQDTELQKHELDQVSGYPRDAHAVYSSARVISPCVLHLEEGYAARDHARGSNGRTRLPCWFSITHLIPGICYHHGGKGFHDHTVGLAEQLPNSYEDVLERPMTRQFHEAESLA
jgi:hypothetical protein